MPVTSDDMSRTIRQVRTKIERITPKKAKEYLRSNTEKQRSVNRGWVDYLTRQILGGHWHFTGDPIRFDLNEKLIDGQHRLLACIKADRPIYTQVVRGLDEKAFMAIDRVNTRTNSQILDLMGVKYHRLASTVTKYVWAWETEGTIQANLPKLSPDEEKIVIDCYPEIVDSCALVKTTSADKVTKGAPLAFVHWLVTRVNKSKADEFVERIGDGVAPRRRYPTLVFRDRFLRLKADRVSLNNRQVVSLIVRTWNAFYGGKDLTVLRIASKGKDVVIPKIAGLGPKKRKKSLLRDKLTEQEAS